MNTNWAAVFCILAASACIAATRQFPIEVRSFAPDSGTLVVSAFPDSGRRFEARLEPESKLTMDRELPRGEIPLDRPVLVSGRILAKGQKLRSEVMDRTTLVAEIIEVPASDAPVTFVGNQTVAVFSRLNGRFVAKMGDEKNVPVLLGVWDHHFPIVWSTGEALPARHIEAGLTGSMAVEEGVGGWTVRSLHLKIQHRPYGTYMVNEMPGPAEPVERIQAHVAKIKARHAGIADNLDRLAPVELRVAPMLVRRGETPRLTIRILGSKKPSAKLTVHPNYLRAGIGGGVELSLEWKAATDKQGRAIHTAEIALPADDPGQYLAHWKCDIGGDIEDYWRSYAVASDGSTIVLLNDCGSEQGADRKLMLDHYLPHTYWMGADMDFSRLLDTSGGTPWNANQGVDTILNPQTRMGSAAWWAGISKAARQYGIEPQLFLFFTTWDDKPQGALNFAGNDEHYIRAVLRAYKDIWPLYRFPMDLLNAGTYAYSTAFTRALMAEGFESNISVCPFHILEHAPGQNINTTAVGHFPHYISTQDFRKTGNESGKFLVSISQATGNYLRQRQGAEAFDITEPLWVALEWNNQAGPRGNYGRSYYSRMFHQVEAYFENVRNHQSAPHFFIAGLEASATANTWAQAGHKILVGELVGKARAGQPVVFATGNAITGYLRRHDRTSPRYVNYIPDHLAGVSQNNSPLEVPDSIDVEDPSFRAVFGRPALLPEFHYDFARDWDYPDFGCDDVIRPYWHRKKAGPALQWKYEITPSTEDWRALKVSRADRPGDTYKITVTVQSPRTAQRLPLAIWDIPREWKPGTGWFKVSGAREFIPVVAPQTDNLNGVLVVDLKEGPNIFTVEITTPARALRAMDTTFAGSVRAKTWTRGTHDGRPVTYLWPINPWGSKVTVTIPEGRTVTAYLTPGTEEQNLPAGTHTFDLRWQQWLRLAGLTREEIAQIELAK